MSLLTPDETLRQTRELWRTCFSDSEAFMDLYFSRKYTAESNVFITRGDQVVAALQAFVYPMNFYGTVVRAGYLSGVARALPTIAARGWPAASSTRPIAACTAPGP